MTATRLLSSAVMLVALCACFPDRALEVRTISLDRLTGRQAAELASPYLSKQGTVVTSSEMLNTITVRDHSRNVERIRSMLSARDASPANISLHFQVIRATEAGGVEAGLERIAGALTEMLRYEGYALMTEAVVSGSERATTTQTLDGGGIPLELGVRVADVRGTSRNGSVELDVDLSRPQGRLLSTNVVIPVGETVVLGTAYPGEIGSALILTVRGEIGTQKLRASRTPRGDHVQPYMRDGHDIEGVAPGARPAVGTSVPLSSGTTVTPAAAPPVRTKSVKTTIGTDTRVRSPARTQAAPPPTP
jgi:hypothetical protein